MKSNNNYRIFYLLIVFFVIMIFIPPLLRVVLPNENQKENIFINNEKEKFISRNLNCSFVKQIGDKNISLNISTNYYDREITSIIFKYDVSAIEDVNLLSSFAIFAELNELKNISGIQYNKNNTEESITVSSNKIILGEPKLQKYSQEIDIQKAYYENVGLVCDIVK